MRSLTPVRGGTFLGVINLEEELQEIIGREGEEGEEGLDLKIK